MSSIVVLAVINVLDHTCVLSQYSSDWNSDYDTLQNMLSGIGSINYENLCDLRGL